MTMPQIDHVSAGYVFVYDAKTGDVLWTHEKIVEVIRGREDYPVRPTDGDCEQVRAEAARVFRGRDVKALIAPEGFTLAENVRVKVDPEKKALHIVHDEGTTLADRFASRYE